ncbi:MAG: hypothetical protein GF393_07910, partial [Armatimonadia bacterium]|nr:hypothetical protein [Armatimonadia bacterium]
MRTTRWLALALAAVLLALPVAADEMQDAMDRADVLNLFLRIDLRPDQARQMMGPLENIQDTVRTHNSARTESLNRLNPTLKRARQQLIAGEDLGDQMVQALENYQRQREVADREFRRAVDAQMQTIASVLTPEQNQ